MICSTSCSTSGTGHRLAALAASLALAGCAGPPKAGWTGYDPRAGPLRVALLPPENLTGGPAPVAELEREAEAALARTGVEVASGDLLRDFLQRHRSRFTGGVDREVAVAARDELNVSAVIVTSVVLYAETSPPRLGLVMRMVSASDAPEILWIDGYGRAGDDSPGLLGLGLVSDVGVLRNEAFRKLTRSLRDFLGDARRRAPRCPTSGAFSPRISFRSPSLRRPERRSVAVLPFVNDSGRRGAGQVAALMLVRQLVAMDHLAVIEPGLLRSELLAYRVTTEGGASPATARLLSKVLGADLVVGGVVRDFQEFGVPVVGFSTLAIEGKREEVLWDSTSYARGDDAVTLFGAGLVSTSDQLTCRMARAIVDAWAPRS
jgi:hypothetical protein